MKWYCPTCHKECTTGTAPCPECCGYSPKDAA